MIEWMLNPHAWIALFTLTALEIILGIDNIIFLTILVAKLPPKERAMGRFFGLSLAMLTRILLLISLVWIIHLTVPLFTVFEKSVSARDLILIAGGLFLIAKSTHEIHQGMDEPVAELPKFNPNKKSKFISIIIQIALIDIIFSIDSVVTAVGLVNQLPVMILAIVFSVFIMMFAAKRIGDFVEAYPSIKMLALSFLILVGFALVGEGTGFHVPKGYIYFAMAYSLGVELLNIKFRSRKKTKTRL